MLSQNSSNVGLTESIGTTLRPELFLYDFGWFGAVATLASCVALLLMFCNRARHLQSGLILSSLLLVLFCISTVNAEGNKLAVIYGCFAAYLLTSVWLERQSWSEHAGATERFLFAIPLAVVFAASVQWLKASLSQDVSIVQSVYLLTLIFMAAMAVIGDVQRIFNGDRSMQLSSDRLRWRLCYGVHVLVASGASLIMNAAELTAMLRPLLFLPECVLLLAALYYLFRTYTDPLSDWVVNQPIRGGSLQA